LEIGEAMTQRDESLDQYDVGDGPWLAGAIPRQLQSEFSDCNCPDREAIVTYDGMVCGTCGQPINPDPSLIIE